MEIRANATRMELLKLKNRLKMAKRGHKLLKDKRDEMMKEFLSLIRTNKELRMKVEESLSRAFKSFLVARSVMSPEVLEEALMSPTRKAEVEVTFNGIMNVSVPRMSLKEEGETASYGFANTSVELDNAINDLSQILPAMIELSQVERTVTLLAKEIEKTRRRVNALEYILIPQLEATIANIEMRIAEVERSNAARLMKVKDIIRAH